MSKFIESPVLAYHINVIKDFCLDTDAIVKGLRAILSLVGEDRKEHKWLMQVVFFQTLREDMQ